MNLATLTLVGICQQQLGEDPDTDTEITLKDSNGTEFTATVKGHKDIWALRQVLEPCGLDSACLYCKNNQVG